MTDALITPEQLKDMDGVVIIDTRAPEAYAAGHIPGAVNLHEIFTFLATSDPEGIVQMTETFAAAFGAAGLSGTETAVIYEGSMNTGFGQSCRGYFLLDFLGYPKKAVLDGGIEAWVAAGLPLDSETVAPVPVAFPVDPAGAHVLLTRDDMVTALDAGDAAILDVRDVDEWIAESSSPYGKDFCPRKGRIPTARWIEWYRLMKPTGAGPRLKSPDEVLAELATVGITPDMPVYLYCFKGARASNSYLALKQAGVADVRIYFGSWNEWSRDPSLPIEEGRPYAS